MHLQRGKPRVSVMISAYNYGRFVASSVRSALGQSGVDVEVVVVDDASTDDTADVLLELASDPRVRVIRHAVNRGHIDTINEGLAAVTGEYVVKLDADDLLAPGALERATALLEQHPEVGFVTGRPVHFRGSPPRRNLPRSATWTIWSGHDWLRDRCRTAYNVISSPEVVMRASVLRLAGPRPRALPHTYDLELWLQLAAMADVGRVNGPAQGYYRVHDDSQQRTVHAGVLFDLEARRDAFAAAFATQAGALPDAAALHERARRALAAQALELACRAYDRGRTDELPVDDLVAFARATSASARDLPEWRALERRVRVGVARAPHDPRFTPKVVSRRAQELSRQRRWARTGSR